MKILILANNDVGLYQFRKELIYELLKEHEVYISLPYGEMVETLKEAGCSFIDTPMDRRGINPLKDLLLLYRYFRILSNIKPDLVITYTIKSNVYGGLTCRVNNIPYVVNMTGLGTAFEGNGWLKRLVINLYKIALKKAKVVFFENSEIMKLFLNLDIVKMSNACVLNGAGVNLSQYQYREYPDNDKFHFLFIGRIMKEKGVDELFIATKKLINIGANCLLDVVGPFEEDYKNILQKNENEGWLKYYGYQKDVRPFIEKCDCFVLPSWHEGMANTNLECAAMGRPVITSNIPGCKEAIIENISGFTCETKNSESLYLVMKKMLTMSKNNRMHMGQEGRKHMIEVFDKNKVVSITLINIFK